MQDLFQGEILCTIFVLEIILYQRLLLCGQGNFNRKLPHLLCRIETFSNSVNRCPFIWSQVPETTLPPSYPEGRASFSLISLNRELISGGKTTWVGELSCFDWQVRVTLTRTRRSYYEEV